METTHSVAARAEQLQDCLERIEAGTFYGSHWDDGQFLLDEKPN